MLENFEQDTQDLKQDSIIFYHIRPYGPIVFERYPDEHKKFTHLIALAPTLKTVPKSK